MTDISNRTAFITGGANGIGLGIARAFAEAGCKLALADLDAAALEAAKKELSAKTEVATFVLDVRDRESFARVADEAEAAFGPVSVVVNNAGVGGGAPAAKLTFEHWDWVMGINVNGVINGVQTFLPRMAERGEGGHIINTASGAGLAIAGTGVLYHTSKYAVVGMSEALRVELEAHKIGVSVLCPGPVATDIVKRPYADRPDAPANLSEKERKFAEESAERVSQILSQSTPPEDVGRMVVEGVKRNQLFIHTDRIMVPFIEERTRVLLEAMPPEKKSA